MPVYSAMGQRVLFVHIPKTGGTSIEKCLRDAGFEESYFGHDFTRYGCRPQHLTAHDLFLEFPRLSFDFVFTVVRDPADRIGSERAWRALLATRQNKPVPDMESFVRSWLDRYCEQASAGDNHFRPQVDFLLPGAHVYRFEQGMDSIMKDILARLDVPESGQSVPHRLAPKVQVDRDLLSLSRATYRRFLRTYLSDYAALDYPLPLRD